MSLRRKIIVASAAVALLNLMLLIVFGDNGLVELSRLRAKEQLMVQRNETLARENVSLYRTIGRLKSDPTYIESVARNELGMIGKDDVIIIFPGSKGQRK
ncbi:MAG: septum formation initiator family protein [Desulfosarcina sp.]|nr:septum formation initiator family protein [Desulfosarcina sp.]MBC2742768.1 septum formation initiator family protein [Desulfosarcina sp.]MBC2765678.1 septum formation initiator family protein [Desulfosarcina sp.]